MLEARPPAEFRGHVLVRYRHLNQGEAYQEVAMAPEGDGLAATVPGAYTGSPYPLQYFFVLRSETGSAWVFPGLDAEGEVRLANQPYYLVRQQGAVAVPTEA